MIKRNAKLDIQRLKLSQLQVYEYQERYPDRLTHYLGLLARNTTDDPGLILVKPREHGYEILDGHHRYVALVMSGREDALCVVIDEN